MQITNASHVDPSHLALGGSERDDLETDESARSLNETRPEAEEATKAALDTNLREPNQYVDASIYPKTALTVLVERAGVVPVAETDGVALRTSSSVNDDAEYDDADDGYH